MGIFLRDGLESWQHKKTATKENFQTTHHFSVPPSFATFDSTMIRAIAITAFLLSALVSPVFSWYDPMICLVNEARRQNGAGPLGFSQGLQNAAWKQAQDMQGTGIVSHFGTLVSREAWGRRASQSWPRSDLTVFLLLLFLSLKLPPQ